MHGLGCLLGLAGELVELCQSIVSRIGVHTPRDDSAKQHRTCDCTK
jgi:hypothetical protein